MVQLAQSPDCFTCSCVPLEVDLHEQSHVAVFAFASLSKLSKKTRFPSRRTKSEIIFCRLFRQSGPKSSKLRFGLAGAKRMGRASFLELCRTGCYLSGGVAGVNTPGRWCRCGMSS
jgi:hypothetical protein